MIRPEYIDRRLFAWMAACERLVQIMSVVGKLLAGCVAVVATTSANVWAEERSASTPQTAKSGTAENLDPSSWYPTVGVGVAGGYGYTPDQSAGFLFYFGARNSEFSAAIETRFLFNIYDLYEAADLELYTTAIAIPVCVTGKNHYGCMIVQIEELKVAALWGGNYVPFKKSHKLGVGFRTGLGSAISKWGQFPIHFRAYLEVDFYASPRKIEVSGIELWQSGVVMGLFGVNYGM